MRKERRLKATQDSAEKVCVLDFPSNHTARVHSLADPRNGFKLFNVAKNSLKINRSGLYAKTGLMIKR